MQPASESEELTSSDEDMAMSQAEECDMMLEGREEWETKELESIPPLPDSMTMGSEIFEQVSESTSRCSLRKGEDSDERINQV